MVPVASIQPNPRQPRTHFDDATLDELAASIREHGIIQPLVLTVDPQRPDRYWLIAGERRWRAAQRAGLQTAPAIVREANPQQLVELALIENLQRADLNPLEEAAAYQTLMAEFGLTQAEVADRVGKSRSAVANAVRLLGLPPEVQHALVDGVVTAGHARALLALPGSAQIHTAFAEVTRRELNVRQTEALVKRLLAAEEAPPAPPEPDPRIQAEVARMEDRFRRVLGTRVSLVRNGDGSGRLVVHFYNEGDLESIYAQIAGPDEPLTGDAGDTVA
jgi:ParB family chromosome partitioning protein